MKRIAFLVALIPAVAQAAPFVAGVSETGDFIASTADWVDAPSTVSTLAIPSGTAVFNWSAFVVSTTGLGAAFVRPLI